MLEFKGFKLLDKKDSNITPIKFSFKDKELDEESIEYIYEKLKEYETYLEYDCKGEFHIKYKKEAIIEMIITSPSRKVPDDKKELEKFINKHVMDFDEYYYKIRSFESSIDTNLAASI
ncbi:MAG: hypothetical protein HZC47_10550 [Methanobacterium sp.]|uniref:hypothetical protein n=1 Tax=Methanobacterium sp. TaxID=2164 RepID=UPI003D64818D|nr:hypothetical protein [Methanobacterium sp.]